MVTKRKHNKEVLLQKEEESRKEPNKEKKNKEKSHTNKGKKSTMQKVHYALTSTLQIHKQGWPIIVVWPYKIRQGNKEKQKKQKKRFESNKIF